MLNGRTTTDKAGGFPSSGSIEERVLSGDRQRNTDDEVCIKKMQLFCGSSDRIHNPVIDAQVCCQLNRRTQGNAQIDGLKYTDRTREIFTFTTVCRRKARAVLVTACSAVKG
jgi:hypothetical protein